ncbi:MAG: HEAT repeat domain-containing protein [Dokdonella sp.]
MTTKLSTAVLGLCLFVMAPVQAMPDGEMAPNDKQLAELYWQGQASLKKSDWSTARERFHRLEEELLKKEPSSADAAVYWQAYALLQAKRNTEAKATLEKLKRDYPGSRWSKDAESLMRQLQPTSGATPSPIGNDDELAEIAITGLMHASPDRAIPILRKVLQGTHSIEVKKRALFVLSQLDEDAALAVLGDIATTSSDAELRGEAIRMLGISGEDAAIEKLRTIYAASKSVEEKRSIIQAWLIADRPELVVQAARSETDEELRKVAIHSLGAMGATSQLHQLFASEKSLENRKAILQSLGIAGDSKTLAEIAGSNEPEEIRIQAIQALGIADDDHSGETLSRIYIAADSTEIRDAALHGLMISGNSDAMLTLYKKAKSKEEKQALLRLLTITNSDATIDLIQAELDKGGKQP